MPSEPLLPTALSNPGLVLIALVGACVWIGGFVAVGVTARVARQTLGPADRVDFFRALGREYGVVSSVALLVGLIAGGLLLAERPWDGTGLALILLAAAVVLSTVLGVRQARGLTRLRAQAVEAPDDDALAQRIAGHAGRATALRATIGLLSGALLVVAVFA